MIHIAPMTGKYPLMIFWLKIPSAKSPRLVLGAFFGYDSNSPSGSAEFAGNIM
jgi:hypothetical protein